MSSYTDEEIREVLLDSAVGHLQPDEKTVAILRWLASEYPRLKADAERYRWMRAEEAAKELAALLADQNTDTMHGEQAWLDTLTEWVTDHGPTALAALRAVSGGQEACPFGCTTQEEHDAHYAKESK